VLGLEGPEELRLKWPWKEMFVVLMPLIILVHGATVSLCFRDGDCFCRFWWFGLSAGLGRSIVG
jgi:hypothetical protein